jgi:tRNA 2-thiouridine synthesizing protein A
MNERAASNWQADAFYDAGDRGCASGALDAIADCIHRLAPNQTLEIRATDPSVTVDLAAWCRLTGHSLVMHAGDRYLIRHK